MSRPSASTVPPHMQDRRPIVEFAIDNVKALKAREHRATQAQTAKAAGGPQADGPVAGQAAGPGAAREDVAAPAPEAEPKSRRQLRKERNMVARERRAAAALAKQDPDQHEKVELAEKGKRKTRAPAERPQPAPVAASVAAPRERKEGAGAAAPSAPAARAAAVAAPEPGPEAAVQPQRKAVLRSQRRRLLRQRKAGKQGGGEHEEDPAPGAGAKKGRHGREDEAWTEPRPRRAASPSNGVVTAGKGQTARKAGHWVGGEAGARAAGHGPKAAGADLKARANPMKQKAVVAAKTVMGASKSDVWELCSGLRDTEESGSGWWGPLDGMPTCPATACRAHVSNSSPSVFLSSVAQRQEQPRRAGRARVACLRRRSWTVWCQSSGASSLASPRARVQARRRSWD